MLRWLLRGSKLLGQPNEGDGPRVPQSRVASAASMMLRTCLGYALGFLLTSALFAWQAHGLQCYGCNIIQERRYVDVGCSNPEVITCSDSHKGFKHRFCLKTESMALGIVLTSGCATSRHCQQQELPGVRIHCCDSNLCNTAPCCRASALHCLCALAMLILLSLWM